MRFANYNQPYINHKYEAAGGGDGGAGDGGAGGGTPPATAPPAINLETATNFVKENGGIVFGNADALSEHVRDNSATFVSDAQKEVYSKIDANLESAFGIKRNDNEINSDYLIRAKDHFKTGVLANNQGGDGSTELTAARTQMKTSADTIKTLEGTIETMKTSAITGDITGQLNTGINSLNLDYGGIEFSSMKNELSRQFNDRYEVKKDERGFIVTDKITQEAVLNPEGQRLSIADTLVSFAKKTEGLRFKSADGGAGNGATLPNNAQGSGGVSPAEQKVVEDRVKKIAAEKGLFGHERQYWEIAKENGLAIPEKLKKLWNL